MKQSIWCQFHGFWHDIEDREERAVEVHQVHEVDVWFSSEDREVLQCVVCGDQWGVA